MSLDRETRRRLAELTRKGVTATPAPTTEPPGPVAPPAQAQPAPPAPPPVLRVGLTEVRHGPLEELLPGVVRLVEEGEYYELRTPVAAYGDWANAAVERWRAAARRGQLTLPGNIPGEAAVFMDTETTGLNNEPLFLVGLLTLDAGEPQIVQLLARHYADEPAVLGEAARRLTAAGLIVTYNGTTFDLPYIMNRLRYHRRPPGHFEPHLDLLPVARQILGRSLGNCRLQTLEYHLCGRERVADIPGGEIPQAYHDFVADGDAAALTQIVTHNSFDLITLAELGGHLARPAGATRPRRKEDRV